MKYILAEACQNTFLLFDCLDASHIDLAEAHRSLVLEDRDDALILVGGKGEGDAFTARMIVLGHDGALGEFCGNGARSCAAYLFAHYPQYARFFLETKWGKHELLQHGEGIYSVKLPSARFEQNSHFMTAALDSFSYVEMIEPHLTFHGKLSDKELFSMGQELNAKRDIFPLGINVNAWHELEEGVLSVKTYERGVQRLTRSCGTGSLACAASYQSSGLVKVMTPGGQLETFIQGDGVVLKGPARFC